MNSPLPPKLYVSMKPGSSRTSGEIQSFQSNVLIILWNARATRRHVASLSGREAHAQALTFSLRKPLKLYNRQNRQSRTVILFSLFSLPILTYFSSASSENL